MKSLYAVGIITLMFSSTLPANEMETISDISLSSEILSLSELLSHIENTVHLVINADYETCQLAYHELKESLKIVYAFDCLLPQDASTILQVLDECYAALIDAIDNESVRTNFLEKSLSLFASERNFDHETLIVQSLQDWTGTTNSSKLKSAVESIDADLVYIPETLQWNVQKEAPKTAVRQPSLILYNSYSLQNSSPKILIIKHKDKSKHKVEVGVDVKLGGKEHGKPTFYFEGELKDKNGNYANAKVSKEKNDDGYDCELKVGTEKE